MRMRDMLQRVDREEDEGWGMGNEKARELIT